MRTEAERNRLVMAHIHLCRMVASGRRGAKRIPFEDLEAAAMVGLVEAARDWKELGPFQDFAARAMFNQISNFIRDWGVPTTAQQDPTLDFPHQVIKPLVDPNKPVEDVADWQSWGVRGNVNAIAEHWETLASTPEEMTIAFDNIKNASAAVRSAMIGFTQREREIFNSRFFANPTLSLEAIAREHEISYARTVYLIDRMLKTIKRILESREAAIPSAMRG